MKKLKVKSSIQDWLIDWFIADDTEDAKPLSPTDQEIAAEIHSRRFRE